MASRSPSPLATAILSDVNAVAGPVGRQLQPLPRTFFQSRRVEERLNDLNQRLIPEPNPGLDKVCSKKLSQAEITAINDALDALVLYARLCFLVEMSNKALTSLVKRIWRNGAWKWILFLYNSGLDLNDTIRNEGSPVAAHRVKVTVAIVDALTGCSDSYAMSAELHLIPEIIALVAKLWQEDLPVPPAPPHILHQQLTRVMYEFVDNNPKVKKPIKATTQVILDTLGPKAIMKAATTYLKQLGSADPIDAGQVHKEVYFIHHLAKIEACRDAMYEVRTLSTAGIVLGKLAREPVDERETPAHEAAEMLTGLLLLGHLISGPDVEPVGHAISKGLMRSLYDARVTFMGHVGCYSALQDTVYHIIGPSMVFRSILHVVEHDENKTRFLEDYKKSPYRFKEWEDILEQYEMELFCRDELDEEDRETECDRDDCPTRGSGKPVKLCCSRCQYTRYCSRECQQLEWPTHKKLCTPDPPDIQSLSDREFIQRLAESEVTDQMERLQKRMQSPALRTHRGDFLLVVDFRDLEREIVIGQAPSTTKAAPKTLMDCRVVIFAQVNNGRKTVRLLSSVSTWGELLTRYDEEMNGVWVKADPSEIIPSKSKVRATRAKGALKKYKP